MMRIYQNLLLMIIKRKNIKTKLILNIIQDMLIAMNIKELFA